MLKTNALHVFWHFLLMVEWAGMSKEQEFQWPNRYSNKYNIYFSFDIFTLLQAFISPLIFLFIKLGILTKVRGKRNRDKICEKKIPPLTIFIRCNSFAFTLGGTDSFFTDWNRFLRTVRKHGAESCWWKSKKLQKYVWHILLEENCTKNPHELSST